MNLFGKGKGDGSDEAPPMSLAEACAETHKFGRMLKGLEHLMAVAVAFEGAEQLIRERQAEADRILGNMNQRIAELKPAIEQAEAKLRTAIDEANRLRETATERARIVKETAEAEGRAIIGRAQTDAQDASRAASDAKASLAEVEGLLTSKRTELKALEAQISKLKASVAALAG